MAHLNSADMTLIDTLFDMYGGRPLQFTNSTFQSFFQHDVGIDIYSDRYAGHGDSKGKRLRAFLEIGSSASIAKALRALWEVRESERLGRGEADAVPHSRARLNSLLAKLGGSRLPAAFDEPAPAPAQPPALPKGPSDADLQALEALFLDLHGMSDQRQARGFAFEKFLQAWFDAWGLDARGSFRTDGEQIDGSFQHDGNTYLVEAKWHAKKTDAATLHAFQGKLQERPHWTRGLFVSLEGFTPQGLSAFTARQLIMMDGSDIFLALRNRIDLHKIIKAKARHASEMREPFARVADLFKA